MSDVAVRVQHLGKRYRIGVFQDEYGPSAKSKPRLASPFEYLAMMLREPTEAETLWALRDVSFEVRRGEVLGIIGPNGAGKSTLLKLISRITQPSTGRIELFGKVGSMLEVGTGFHPELTGRENIYVNGALLGMKPPEIGRKFDAIVEFSGIEKLLDTMVKYYSSGMYVRLAFAVAAFLESDILIVDEVLSIGDAEFQKKCLGRMGDLSSSGRTILFVSHNMAAIRGLCPNTILMANGSIAVSGRTDEVVGIYLGQGKSNVLARDWKDPRSAPGSDFARLHRIWINSAGAANSQVIARTMPLEIGVEYWNLIGAQLRITLQFIVEGNTVAFTTSSSRPASRQNDSGRPGLVRSICRVPEAFLNRQMYYVRLLIEDSNGEAVLTLEDALSFHVTDTEKQTQRRVSLRTRRRIPKPSMGNRDDRV